MGGKYVELIPGGARGGGCPTGGGTLALNADPASTVSSVRGDLDRRSGF